MGPQLLVAFERVNVDDELQGEVVSGAPNMMGQCVRNR